MDAYTDHDYQYSAQLSQQDLSGTSQPALPTTPPSQLPHSSRSSYTSPQSPHQVRPKRPSISTNFTDVSAHLTRLSTGSVDSPDPDEFYRPYRNPASGALGTKVVRGDHYPLLTAGTSNMMTSTVPLSPPSSKAQSTASPKHRYPQSLSRSNNSRSGSIGSNVSPTDTAMPATKPPYLSAARPSHGSLKALVDKFNAQSDELPPLPHNNNTLRVASQVSRNFRGISPIGIRSASTPQASVPTFEKPTKASRQELTRLTSTTNQRGSVSTPITGLKSSALASVKKPPLFGEILDTNTIGLDPGYGIPNARRRRLSDTSIYMPASIARDSMSAFDDGAIPSSPTAWYRNYRPPSLEMHSTPREGAHRRTRSDFAYPPTDNSISISFKMDFPIVEDAHNVIDASTPMSPKPCSRSRIPVSVRRTSLSPSESGSSLHSIHTTTSTLSKTSSSISSSRQHSFSKGISGLPVPVHQSPSSLRRPPSRDSSSVTPFRNERVMSVGRPSSSALKAYISVPPLRKSPTLRSSRPRQPVSTATTAASRAKAADSTKPFSPNRLRIETSAPEPKQRFPELGHVDFAARRQRIQQAFNKTVRENEKEAERKRLAQKEDKKFLKNFESTKSSVSRINKDRVRGKPEQVKDEGQDAKIDKVQNDSPEKEKVAGNYDYQEQESCKEPELVESKLQTRLEEKEATSPASIEQISPDNQQEDKQDAVDESVPVDLSSTDSTYETQPEPVLQLEESTDISTPTTPAELEAVAESVGYVDAVAVPEPAREDSSSLSVPRPETPRDKKLPPDDRLPPPSSDGTSIYQTPPSSNSSPGAAHSALSLRLTDAEDEAHDAPAENAAIPSALLSSAIFDLNKSEETITIAQQVSDDDDATVPQETTSPHSSGLHEEASTNTPQTGNEHETCSEADDAESVQIMLGATPVNEQFTPFKSTEVTRRRSNFVRAHVHSWSSSDSFEDPRISITRSRSLERIDENLPVHRNVMAPPHVADDHAAPAWSPASFSSMATGRSTMNSESYSIVQQFLEQYYHPLEPLTPKLIQDFQQYVLERSPNLGRQSEWDFHKFTQEYLEEYVRMRVRKMSSASQPAKSESMPHDEPALPERSRHVSIPSSARSSTVWTSDSFEQQAQEEPSRTSKASEDDDEDDDDYRPTPPPKDSPTFKSHDDLVEDQVDTQSPVIAGPQLPEIESTGGILGLAINVENSEDVRLKSFEPDRHTLLESASERPSLDYVFDRPTRPLSASPSIYSKNPPSSFYSIDPRMRATKISSARSSTEIVLSEGFTMHPPTQAPAISSASRVSIDQQSQLSVPDPDKAGSPSPEERRLKKRWHLIKELIETEHTFGNDMKVVDDIYKGTSASCLGLSIDDTRILFGNSDDIVTFSMEFLDALKQAGKSVYTMPKSRRFRKRASAAVSLYSQVEDQASASSAPLTDDEKDRRTFIGEVFGQYMQKMEKVYAEYLRNHDAANRKLEALQQQPNVRVWLNECRTFADDLTSAWNLDSLLVKPVQRILKYPLLLKDLVACTPEDHPDYTALSVAAREIIEVSTRINEMKKRADLVDQAVNKRKRKESDVRIGFTKAFGRRTEKLRLQVGLAETFEDREYDILSQKFDGSLFNLTCTIPQFEQYIQDVQTYINGYNTFISAIEGFIEASPTSHPDLESKWRRFRMSVRDISGIALREHISAIRKSVIDPLNALVKLHQAPIKIKQKRDKRLSSYARFKSVTDRGDKPDKKTVEQSDQFQALNETLKDELPKMIKLTKTLVETCLHVFIEIQQQWSITWRKKIGVILEDRDIPDDLVTVIQHFLENFQFVEAQALSLSICNGSLLHDTANLIGPLSLSSTNPNRYSMNGGRTYPASICGDGASPFLQFDQVTRANTSHASSPMGDSLSHASHSLYHHSSVASSTGLLRSSSNATAKEPTFSEEPKGRRSLPTDGPPFSGRPSMASVRGSEPAPSLPRLSIDAEALSMNHPEPASLLTLPPIPQEGHELSSSTDDRFSDLFSSAMPMSDSPTAQTAAGHGFGKQYKRLFTVVSVFPFKIDPPRTQAGYPFLEYNKSEVFDVLGELGDLWLARNQDDQSGTVGWIWYKHFMRIAE